MGEMMVSRRRGLWRRLALVALFAAAASGCASTQDQEVQRLRARATYEQGLSHLGDKRVSLALASLQEAVRLEPAAPLYHNTLGVVYLHYLSKPAEAQAEFQKAIELDPTYAEALTNLGVTLAQQGKWEEAIVAYRKAISLPIYPTPEVAYANLGWAYLNLGKQREAEESYRTAVQLQPRFAQAYYFLGVVLDRQGRKEEARSAFRSARDLDPDSPFGRKASELLQTMGEGG
jgi:type IV pilus assembly protein PilF